MRERRGGGKRGGVGNKRRGQKEAKGRGEELDGLKI